MSSIKVCDRCLRSSTPESPLTFRELDPTDHSLLYHTLPKERGCYDTCSQCYAELESAVRGWWGGRRVK